jgi:Skp family chaperone for outer membrane proteins
MPNGALSSSCLLLLVCCGAAFASPGASDTAANKTVRAPADISQIVQESARVTEGDRKASREFDWSETDLESDGSHKTYRVHMLFGSPYRELIAVNDRPLPPDERQEQERKFKNEISRREHETEGEHASRVAEFEKEQNRDRRFIEEFVRAFNFKLLRTAVVDGRAVYVVQATPRAGYRPSDRDSQVLTGMRGELWIDKTTYQWVKAEAEVVHPVAIAGFVATVEPGTRFVLEKTPVIGNVWLAKHFSMNEKAEIFSFISHKKHEDVAFFDYHRTAYPDTSRKHD